MADHCPAKSFLDNVPNKYHLIVLGAGHVQPGIFQGVVIIMTPVCPNPQPLPHHDEYRYMSEKYMG